MQLFGCISEGCMDIIPPDSPPPRRGGKALSPGQPAAKTLALCEAGEPVGKLAKQTSVKSRAAAAKERFEATMRMLDDAHAEVEDAISQKQLTSEDTSAESGALVTVSGPEANRKSKKDKAEKKKRKAVRRSKPIVQQLLPQLRANTSGIHKLKLHGEVGSQT